jgi:hypothetical protein
MFFQESKGLIQMRFAASTFSLIPQQAAHGLATLFPVIAIYFLTGISVSAEINATANVILRWASFGTAPSGTVHEYQFFQKIIFHVQLFAFVLISYIAACADSD